MMLLKVDRVITLSPVSLAWRLGLRACHRSCTSHRSLGSSIGCHVCWHLGKHDSLRACLLRSASFRLTCL
jgi:hypothetical protein